MYIKAISIRNIRGIRNLIWQLDSHECAGWHVFIGDNGSGKSTILRAASLVLVGREDIQGLRQDWNEWLKKGETSGSIQLEFEPVGHEQRPLPMIDDPYREVLKLERSRSIPDQVNLISSPSFAQLSQHHSFSAAFGPYRRFSGNSKDYGRLNRSSRKLAAHLSIFGEDIALAEALEWLRELNYRRLEGHADGQVLSDIQSFINQDGFLPHGTRFTSVSSDGVEFTDGSGSRVRVENLSDGFRSVLSMTFEIIRQLQLAFPTRHFFSDDKTQVITPGIILIDEVDAHLHPTWQKEIGYWLREHFPAMQFIVTTHSPLVCHAAEQGSVWKLPTPGTDEECRRVTGVELSRVLYGNISEAYSTNLFGLTTTRSDEGKDKLERLAELNLKEVFYSLNEAEVAEQAQLREILPTLASTTETNRDVE